MSEPIAPAEYIRLAFWIDRHFPGYVDAYYGPPEMKAQAMAGDLPSLEALDELAASLERSISADAGLAADRRAYLEEEARAMRTTLRILGRDAPDIIDEVRSLYGVTPAWVDERLFEQAHRDLDQILPGQEPLPERVQGFRERSRVPVETAVSIIRRLLADFRSRTLDLFALPPGEGCEISVVMDKPWRAYNWYLGGRKSRIEFNQDAPIEAWDIPTIVAHEAYPGHHTERVTKEEKLYLGEGRLEHSIALSNTPSALVSEGIAKNALRVLIPEDEIESILVDCYERAGLSRSDALHAMAFVDAYSHLDNVTDNQVLLLFRDHASEAEVMAYGMRYSLTTREDEERLLRFVKDPLSRSYTYNYTLGSQLVAAFLDHSPDKQRAFQRLLSEPMTPSQIHGLVKAASYAAP
jgi:hypothetical protein